MNVINLTNATVLNIKSSTRCGRKVWSALRFYGSAKYIYRFENEIKLIKSINLIKVRTNRN